MNFKHLKTDINSLSIGTYDQICKSGNLRLLIKSDKQNDFDREFVLSLVDKIREILNSERSLLWKISSFIWLMVGMYAPNEETLKNAKYRHLEKAFDYIDTQIFDLRGASSDLIKKKKLKQHIINLRNEVYVGGKLFSSNNLRKAESQLKELEDSSLNSYNLSETFAAFSKELGFNLKPFEVSISEFFGYSDMIAKRNK